jgi:hypothetical protein
MKTKINKILSVLATVAIVASMFVVAMPVAASTPGDSQWTAQDLPGTADGVILNGSTIKDFAVGSDGKTIYTIGTQAVGAYAVVTAVATAPGFTSAGKYTMNYDSQTAPGQISNNFYIAKAATVGTIIPIPLASGDDSVKTVNSVAVVTAGTAGDKFSIVSGANSFYTAIDANSGVGTAGSTLTTPTKYIYKSTDGGQSFDSILNNYATSSVTPTTGGTAPVAISIAPDDVNTVAVVDTLTAGVQHVIITKDGGTTWSALPNPTLGATGVITDIAVAPARSGTLLGREYLISMADTGVTTACGDVQIIGNTAAWATVGAVGAVNTLNVVAGSFDFTSVVVTPNFLGDRCVVAVGTKPAAGSTALVIVNTATNTIIVGGATPVPGVPLLTTGHVLDVGATATLTDAPIVSSSIALPTNFDPTSASGRRAYVGIASGLNTAPAYPADNDVYRVDDTAARALGAGTAAPIYSVTYSGTTDTGILLMGPNANTDVKYSKDMTGNSPTWTTTLKSPTSMATIPKVIVKVAADYATTSRVFAGTVGRESAFFVSNDAGVSFNAKALVNCGNDNTGSPSLGFTSDAKTVFFSSVDASNYLVIWKSDVPFTTTSWSRIFAKAMTAASATAGQGLAAGSSLKTSGTSLFYFETKTINGPIYVSADGGTSFATRNGPTGAGYGGAAARDTQTLYYYDTTTSGNVFKSTNAGWTWSTAVSSGAGTINTSGGLVLPKANQIIAAGTGGVAISNDDGATFTNITSGLPTTASIKWSIAADSKYSDNSIIYTVDMGLANTAGQWTAYRVNTNSTSNAWETMPILAGAITGKILGVTTKSGVLYITTDQPSTPAAGPFTAFGGVLRTLYPTDLIGNQNWQSLANGLSAGNCLAGGIGTAGAINLYGKTANTSSASAGYQIYAFNDYLAAAKPTLTEPADNYADAINPTGGNGYALDLKWKVMGTGTSQVDRVDVEIVDKNNGFTGNPSASALTVSPTNPIVNTGNALFGPAGYVLQPNHVYLWRVRAARTTSTQSIDSLWSDARTINVQAGSQVQQAYAGPVLLGPQGGAQNLDPNLVGFAWAPVSGATEYTVIVATDAALTKTVSSTPAKVTVPAYQATGLAYGTTYFWAVQATKPTTSIQTMGTFTTMQKPVAAAAAPTAGATAAAPPQTIIVQPTAAETPAYIWAVIAIGAILVIAVIILIVRTRRVP